MRLTSHYSPPEPSPPLDVAMGQGAPSSARHDCVPLKQEQQWHAPLPPPPPPARNNDSNMTPGAMTTNSPVSDSDKLSFVAATALMMAPPGLDDDAMMDPLLRLAFSDDDSSDSFASVKTEDSSGPLTATANPRAGRRSTVTKEERRKRRNLKERERVHGVKKRLEDLRLHMEDLQHQVEEMQQQLEQRVIVRATSDNDIQALAASLLAQPGTALDARDVELLHRYLQLVKETDELKFRKRVLEDQLRPRKQATADVNAIATENTFSLEDVDSSKALRAPNSTGRNTDVVVRDVDPLEIVPPIRMDPVSLFEAMLGDDPLTPDEARECVEATCRDMMEGLARNDWVEGFQGFGWTGSRRFDGGGSELQFKLSQEFKGISATSLVEKTWKMLTNLDEYRRIQPQTQQLRVIQKVNDECLVIGAAVGQERPRLGHLLVARAIIHGGYLITFRSLPLLRQGRSGCEYARRKFVESETGGMHVNIHSWYNFQERLNADGSVDCQVIFGGSSRNGDHTYLQQLQTEVVAGMTRWQSAVGFSNFVFSPTLTNRKAYDDDQKPIATD